MDHEEERDIFLIQLEAYLEIKEYDGTFAERQARILDAIALLRGREVLAKKRKKYKE